MSINILSHEETQVASRVEALRQAILKADGPALDDLAEEGLTYGHSNAKVDGRATFLQKLSGETPAFREIEISDQSILIVGTTSVVRHTFAAVLGDGTGINLHHVLVWVNRDGQWRMLARQAVRLP